MFIAVPHFHTVLHYIYWTSLPRAHLQAVLLKSETSFDWNISRDDPRNILYFSPCYQGFDLRQYLILKRLTELLLKRKWITNFTAQSLPRIYLASNSRPWLPQYWWGKIVDSKDLNKANLGRKFGLILERTIWSIIFRRVIIILLSNFLFHQCRVASWRKR